MSLTTSFPRTSPEARILVVDDEEPIRRSLVRVLDRAGYVCATAASAAEARQLLTKDEFDLMLCDVTMPGESGFSLLAHAHELQPDLAVILVTAVESREVVQPATRRGAYGYILKPFDTNMILINVVGALRARAQSISQQRPRSHAEIEIASHIAELEGLLARLAHENVTGSSSREDIVQAAALLAEWRDADAASHLHRMSTHSARLATLAGLSPHEVENIRLASQLHDIGKVDVPAAILLKSRLLTEEERLVMQGHTETGFKMLTGSESPLLQLATTIALSHHERFDGNGYPHRLAGKAIPLEGRIVAIADVFDALRSKRPYKRAYSQKESLQVFRARRRAQLDPELLDLFISDLETAPNS